MACEGNPATMTPGIPSRVQDEIKKIGDGYSAYDISCNLATTGIVVTRLVGNTTYLSYQVLNNRVEFYVTTPFTCHRDRGTFLCPNDPRFSVTFASEIWTVVRTPALCQLTAEGGTVNLHAVQIDSHNFSGDVAKNIIVSVDRATWQRTAGGRTLQGNAMWAVLVVSVTNRGTDLANGGEANQAVRLVDERGREFTATTDVAFLIDVAAEVMSKQPYDLLAAGVTDQFVFVFPVAPDARTLTLRAAPFQCMP